MNILEKIGLKTQERINKEKEILSLEELKNKIDYNKIPDSFKEAFLEPKTNIIAEIKLASPSEGKISDLNPIDVAKGYLENGATALSVLTEPYYFNGSTDYIIKIREKFPKAKILMKDFFVDEYQFYQARFIGANAVLLIVALLGKDKIKEFLNLAKKLNLTALVEVHNKEEMEIAIELEADFIGVNNRNLKDMSISLDTSINLASLPPKNTILISESGIKTSSDIEILKKYDYKGFLVGTSFMKTEKPWEKLIKILS
ncbi:MAG: indole-3-glycerol phosphate synthase TrpC [Candidatus Sericytochromatia bacterium]